MADKTLNITTGAAPWATAGSWTPSGVPTTGDRVFIDSGASDLVITAASTQAAVLLAEIVFLDTFTGTFDVDVAATIWRVGLPSGSTSANGGSPKIVINNGTNAGTFLFYKSAASVDASSGLSAIRWTGTHASANAMYVFPGAQSVEIGTSLAASVLTTLDIQGGNVVVRQNATTKFIVMTAGKLVHNGLSNSAGTFTQTGGTSTTTGDTKFPAITLTGNATMFCSHRAASGDSATTVTIGSGATLNLQGDPRAFSVTTSITLNAGGVLEHFGLSQITTSALTVPVGRLTAAT
jgi:hypothetical protein